MSTQKFYDCNGGPAFAVPEPCEHGGMTLRDYFAAKAMHAEISTAGMEPEAAMALSEAADEAGQTIEQRIAFNAYRIADAMLQARAQGETADGR